MKRIFFILVALGATLAVSRAVIAGPGHDHGDAAPTASGPSLPRFTASSDLFDAVGVLGKDELVVYVDRAATNEPVLNAVVELESGSVKAVGKFEAALGEYHFDGKPFQATAVHPITLTIKAGNDLDLLSADLDVHGEDAATAAASASSWIPHTFRDHPVAVLIGLLVLIGSASALVIFLKSKSRTEFRNRSAA
jgi:hypothetical protein